MPVSNMVPSNTPLCNIFVSSLCLSNIYLSNISLSNRYLGNICLEIHVVTLLSIVGAASLWVFCLCIVYCLCLWLLWLLVFRIDVVIFLSKYTFLIFVYAAQEWPKKPSACCHPSMREIASSLALGEPGAIGPGGFGPTAVDGVSGIQPTSSCPGMQGSHQVKLEIGTGG